MQEASSFNSSMVRLVVGIYKMLVVAEYCFNSSMVRLVDEVSPYYLWGTKFQFQYGAIGGKAKFFGI